MRDAVSTTRSRVPLSCSPRCRTRVGLAGRGGSIPPSEHSGRGPPAATIPSGHVGRAGTSPHPSAAPRQHACPSRAGRPPYGRSIPLRDTRPRRGQCRPWTAWCPPSPCRAVGSSSCPRHQPARVHAATRQGAAYRPRREPRLGELSRCGWWGRGRHPRPALASAVIRWVGADQRRRIPHGRNIASPPVGSIPARSAGTCWRTSWTTTGAPIRRLLAEGRQMHRLPRSHGPRPNVAPACS